MGARKKGESKRMKNLKKSQVSKVLVVKQQGRTRCNEFKLEKFRFNADIAKRWFTDRVLDDLKTGLAVMW